MSEDTLKQKLDYWYKKICTSDFISLDPVQFPRRFKKHEDIEIAAILTATIAWGRRGIILQSAEKMFALTGKKLYDFVMSGSYEKLNNNNIHRTFFGSDLKYICKGFEHIYKKHGNLEKLFASVPGIWDGINLFREEMLMANKGVSSVHIANPGSKGKNGSACKKINLALRWLVRDGPVDIKLWKSITPATLNIPLDVHVSRTARNLGLLTRITNDKKAVIELTEKLKGLCPEDPVKYDFALFGMGALSTASSGVDEV